jgi:hypothetical protein
MIYINNQTIFAKCEKKAWLFDIFWFRLFSLGVGPYWDALKNKLNPTGFVQI